LVLFDLDNTLYDHSHGRDCGWRALQKDYPVLARIPLTRLGGLHEQLLLANYGRVLDGAISMDRARVERFRMAFKHWGIDAAPGEVEVATNRFRDAYEANERAVPGSDALLEALRIGGVTAGVVTNGPTAVQRRKLNVSGLAESVDFLLTSEDAGSRKPEPDIFRQALERGGPGPDRAVMVGDLWDADILGAHRVGIRPVWFNRDNIPCPDPTLAAELHSFEPLETALAVIAGS